MAILIGTIIVTEDGEVEHMGHDSTIQDINHQYQTEVNVEQLEQFLLSKVELFDVGGPYWEFDDVIKEIKAGVYEDVAETVQEWWNETWEGQSYVLFDVSVEYDRSFVYILDDSKMLVDMES